MSVERNAETNIYMQTNVAGLNIILFARIRVVLYQ